jgi:hypothetical protein
MMIGITRDAVMLRVNGQYSKIWYYTNNSNDWTHYAITRSGTNVTLWANGVNQGSVQINFNVTDSDPLYIGGSESLADYYTFGGYIDELRVSNSARYSNNFTPSTQAYTNDANTVFLLHFDTNFADDNSSTFHINSNRIFISKTTSTGLAVNNYLKFLRLGSRFVIEDRADPSNYQLWRMTGSIADNGTYISLPVAIVESSGTGTTNLANLTNINLGIDTGVQGIQGNQGIQGVQGISGPNTTVSQTQPEVFGVGNQWFNSTTQILKVYAETGWVQVTADDLTF